MIGDEADRADEDRARALRHQLTRLLQDVRPQPRLRRAPRALEGEVPAALGQPQLIRHTARRRQQLALVGIVPLTNALWQTVRGEEDKDTRARVRRERRIQ